MKYYCLANPVPLVKIARSPRFIDNLPGIGVPLFDLLPIKTQDLNATFRNSQQLLVCESLEDAKKIRLQKIQKANSNMAPDFMVGKIRQQYPLYDYGIYEIETSRNIDFINLNDNPSHNATSCIDPTTAPKSSSEEESSGIKIALMTQDDLQPVLVNTYYFDVKNDEDILHKPSCNIM